MTTQTICDRDGCGRVLGGADPRPHVHISLSWQEYALEPEVSKELLRGMDGNADFCSFSCLAAWADGQTIEGALGEEVAT